MRAAERPAQDELSPLHAHRYRTLLTAPGLDMMLARGLMDAEEHGTLLAAQLPPARWYMVVLEWVMAGIAASRREGLLVGDVGFESTARGQV